MGCWGQGDRVVGVRGHGVLGSGGVGVMGCWVHGVLGFGIGAGRPLHCR